MCPICNNKIEPGTAAITLVGGLFPVEEPDFFMMDETISPEQYVHKECILAALAKGVEKCGS